MTWQPDTSSLLKRRGGSGTYALLCCGRSWQPSARSEIEARREAIRGLRGDDMSTTHTPPELYFCCGFDCPGLEYRASDRAHPPSCTGDGWPELNNMSADMCLGLAADGLEAGSIRNAIYWARAAVRLLEEMS